MRQKLSYGEVSAVRKFKYEETHLCYKEAEKAVVSKRKCPQGNNSSYT